MDTRTIIFIHCFTATTTTMSATLVLHYVDVWSMYFHRQAPNVWKLCCSLHNLCSSSAMWMSASHRRIQSSKRARCAN